MITQPADYQDGNAFATGHEPFDLSELHERCLGEASFCFTILRKFADRAADQLAALERAARSGNLVELAQHSRTIRGVAVNLSAAALSRHATELEQAARIGHAERIRSHLDLTRVEVHRCLEAMPEALRRLAVSA